MHVHVHIYMHTHTYTCAYVHCVIVIVYCLTGNDVGLCRSQLIFELWYIAVCVC